MKRKKILMVDDSKTTLYLEELLLRSEYDLVRAYDGEAALQAARRHDPDLILLDVRMPGMDGLEVCRRLRQGEMEGTVPIIIVSRLGDNADLERGFVEGCTDYITKPINGQELVAKIRHCLAG